ncbi:SulP family inorganic anion transporter [Cyanobacterium aponinum UTEX 3222]|uniref:Sulfate transporter n=3 Tax=Cyanobacterium aponinum TaxID=379064 RepID=K9Z1F4_CYAAP|nr:SulP family inorganic anion transporter [Cyanobacterium aponinum]WRL43926.1 SulP family inorganic anion transporter [Cyanobacterium aponinum UTEX 3222]AFZ52405.1 sulfate transporter [Cyanobacterium aponinum PCC 10605]MTF37669.1 STAS domain-containing protein [Cyanobacterium aponinum 0216]WPF87584.1 SulP family inorganic anion transporter [Cyanobacterium aponinum AL20115]WRL39376.1 SulP family inorganic anion transporter [Cyanobacterium aponinum UTEX 3221]
MFINSRTLKREWFSNIKADILAGAVVGLALIPEAIAFSIIAGVDPKVGLYASFIIAVITAFLGGRTGSISAATGAMALLMVNLVKDHGIEYLFAATLLTGILQVLFGVFKLGKQMKYVPRAVMMGYINALGVLIFLAQLPQLTNVPSTVYLITIASLLIIYILPRFTQVVPSPLVALAVMTIATITLKLDVPTVGDMGELPTTLPIFALPNIPLNLETLNIILPYSLTMALVGLLASFLTAALVDELTDTPSDKNQEAKGQGIANIVTSFFGGMAGCGMIGQSVINVQSGGRGRLSTFSAGIFLLFAILVLQDWVKQMPMGALVAVMIMVSIGTIRWSSFKNIPRTPPTETAVMLATMLITIATRNFALGVITGIIMSTVFFSRQIAQLVFVDKVLSEDGNHRTYNVSGQIFFVSIEEFLGKFDFDELVDTVTINLTHAHLWDQGAVAAVDKVVLKFRRNGAEVKLIGLNQASATLLEKLTTQENPPIVEELITH